jgi:hypothetical protein
MYFYSRNNCWVLVAHTCNPSNSGGRHQENHGSKPANSSRDPILQKPITKSAGGVVQSVSQDFNLSTAKKKKNPNTFFPKLLIVSQSTVPITLPGSTAGCSRVLWLGTNCAHVTHFQCLHCGDCTAKKQIYI